MKEVIVMVGHKIYTHLHEVFAFAFGSSVSVTWVIGQQPILYEVADVALRAGVTAIVTGFLSVVVATLTKRLFDKKQK